MKRKYILPLLLPVQIIILNILSFFPGMVERFYSNAIYICISRILRIALGWIPFSVGDIIYFIVIFLTIRWFWRTRKTWKSARRENLLKMFSVISVAYFIFHLLWATNYHRERLFDKMQINTEYTDAELLAFTKKLIVKTNEIHGKLVKDPKMKVIFPYSQQQVFDKNLQGYNILAREYPFFTYDHPSIKTSIISLPLTYMGFAGYLNPFTNEAQVNYMLPMYTFPTVTCHEMAHQLGYASESEANFIGYLASVKNPDLYFQYSGYVTALHYCLANWEIRNEDVMHSLMKTVRPGILANYKESQDFWDQYESFVETGFKIFYDNFLKMNQQKDGLESYSKFVDLLVNYYRNRPL